MASIYEQQQQQLQQQQAANNNIMMNDQQQRAMYSSVDTNMITTPMTTTYATPTEIYPSGSMLLNPQHQMIDQCNGGPAVSLSEASVCSSMGIKTPDIQPISDITLPLVTQAVSYRDVVYNHHQLLNNSHELPPYVLQDPIVVWPHESMTPVIAPPTGTATTDVSSIDNYSTQLSRSSSIMSIKSAMQQQSQCTLVEPSSSPFSSSLSGDDMVYQFDGADHIMQQHHEEQLVASMRTSPSNRRYTVSLPPCGHNPTAVDFKMEEEKTSTTEKEIRRQSMNDILPKSFCHLSREQLIERVVQLEKEKQLTSNKLLLESKASSKVLSESKIALLDSNNNSDEDDCNHTCLWAGCDTVAISLDQLINHIKDVHIGGGKAAYYCEWANCSRERKPFVKRHKMQNHMRTHTGERPYECTVEDCDKRFSRQDSLNTHIKTHSSIRPYACPVESCGKAYFHSRSLRKHAKSHEAVMVTEKNHPYDRSLKPPPKYHQACGTTTPPPPPPPTTTTTTTNTFYITPINNNATAQPIIIQQQQQQQIFAAGPAYVPYHHQHYYAQPYTVPNSHPSYANPYYEQHQYSY